jgi:integrase/recombinase XerD
MAEEAYMDETATDKNTKIDVLAGEFISHLAAHNHSPNSVRGYRHMIRDFNDFMKASGKSKAVDITPQDIADYRLNLVERKFKHNSMYTYLRTIRSFFKYLHDQDHVFVDPAAGMRLPGLDRYLQPVPTEDEIRKLLSLPDTGTPLGVRDRSILETLYSTALRREEAAAVNQQDIDLLHCAVRIMGKGKKERIVPLGREALAWVRRYLDEARDKLMNGRTAEPALWLNTQGGRLSGQQMHRFVKSYAKSCEAIKTPITTHSLRRACATHMLQHGASPFHIQMLLGHSDLTHLRNYLRLSIHDLKAAHERTRLNE